MLEFMLYGWDEHLAGAFDELVTFLGSAPFLVLIYKIYTQDLGIVHLV